MVNFNACGVLRLAMRSIIVFFVFARSSCATNYHSGRESVNPLLDADSLYHRELSIVSYLRDDSKHRSLQTTDNCMQDLYGKNALSCGSQDIKFLAITGVVVYDEGAYLENGIWKDACRGKDDYVNLSFTANVSLSSDRFDIGMYINTEGGSALTGTCTMSLLTPGDYTATDGGTVTIGYLEGTPDQCPDVTGGGVLVDYAFAPLTLKCFDTPGTNGAPGDGLLDFDVAIAWNQNENQICNPDSVSTWPLPGTSSKCWNGDRFTVSVDVPPWNSPSSQPSVSFKPSASPSRSAQPSSFPSSRPSDKPSSSPSLSAHPSKAPSALPSSVPSSSPSVSAAPSDQPSRQPSFTPTDRPSRQPSDQPSESPSVSAEPSNAPSGSPTLSSQPTISARPTHNTEYPSSVPSISGAPTNRPSISPSVSKMPSISPSGAPSSEPSASPTGSLYYPDWINESQVCKNDGADPEYMAQVQRDNYLYRSKEECCQNHFWWRIQQCMGNEKPMYYSNGSFCDQKVVFEDWESKYTPGTWSSSDQFDTLRECCVAKFWWDIDSCIASSPKELTFSFSIDIGNIILPLYCQDADTIGNALETAINIGLGSSSVSAVTQIGCATLSRNVDTGNTECGGCLDGSYTGDFDGSYPSGYYSSASSTTVVVDVNTKNNVCSDSACFQSLYNSIIADFTAFVNSGDLTTEIVTWSQNRAPPIPELWNAEVDMSSFSTSGSYSDPFSDPNSFISATSITAAGELSVSGLPTSLTNTQEQELVSYFETSIQDTLDSQGILLDGSIVTVTGISGGVVFYEITINADSQSDASQAISQINSSLDEPTTLTSIAASIKNESSGGSLSLSSLSIDSNTAGSSTETTVSKATSSGQLTTSVITTGLSSAEIATVESIFADSITKTLDLQGVLPEGSFVTITSIVNGVVNYQITMFVDPTADAGSIVSSIDSTFSESSTLSMISDWVKSDSTGLIVATALSSVTVTGFTAGSTTGIPNNPWYPDFADKKNSCSNDGFAPQFMNSNPNDYLFSSKQECCDQWFSYDPYCTTAASTKMRFYPDYSTGLCSRKQEREFESWERDRYESLEECCSAKFSTYNYNTCCAAPGLGGCSLTGNVVYVPNWSDSSCFAKSETALSGFEEIYASSTASQCCSSNFGWRQKECCLAAGGCQT